MIRLGLGWHPEVYESELKLLAIRELRIRTEEAWNKWRKLSDEERDARSIKGKKI